MATFGGEVSVYDGVEEDSSRLNCLRDRTFDWCKHERTFRSQDQHACHYHSNECGTPAGSHSPPFFDSSMFVQAWPQGSILARSASLGTLHLL